MALDDQDRTELEEKIHELSAQVEQLRAEAKERDKAENELREEERRFRTIVEQSKDAILQFSADGGVIYASPSCEEIFGYSPEEIIANPGKAVEMLHPDYVAQYRTFWDNFKKNRYFSEQRSEWAWVTRDGNEIFTENTIVNVLDDRGNIIGFETIVRDITKRKQAEDALRDSEERYRSLFETSPEIIVIVGLDGRILDANRVSGKIRMMTKEELIGKHFSELLAFDETEVEKYMELFMKAVNGEVATYEVDFETDSGEIMFLEVYISRLMKDNETYALQVIAHDVTDRAVAEKKITKAKGELEKRVRERTEELSRAKEQLEKDLEHRKKVEGALRESEDKYRGLFDSSPFTITIVGMDGRILDVNPASEITLGFPLSDFIGKHFMELNVFPEEIIPDLAGMFQGVINGSQEGPMEICLIDNEGRKQWQEISVAQIMKNGEPTGFQFISQDITERKESEFALQESEDKYRRLVENMQREYFFYSHNTDGVFTYLSQSVEDILGYSPEEYMKHYEETLTDNPANEQGVYHTEQSIKGMQQPPYEVEVFHKDGGRRWFEVTEYPSMDEHGNVKAVEGIAKDITLRKKTEDALRESEERFRRLAEHSRDIIARWIPGFGVEYINPAVIDVLGYTPEQVVGHMGFLISKVHPLDLGTVRDSFMPDSYKGFGGPVEFRVFGADGRLVWCEIISVPIKDDDGNVTCVEFFARDITDRKKAEDARNREKQILEDIIDNNPFAIQLLDRQGRTIRCNRTFLDLVKRPPPADARVFDIGILHDAGLEEYMERAKAGQTVHFPESSVNLRDFSDDYPDRELNFRSVIFPVHNPDGEIENYVLMHQDITEQRRAQEEKEAIFEQLLHSQKMEALGALAGGMSHEFNNILSVIMGTAEMALRKMDPEEENFKRVKRILASSERARELTTQLLTFARKEKLEMTVMSVGNLVSEVEDILNRSISQNIKIVKKLQESNALVRGDANHLQQAIINICLNAIDAMGGSGTLGIDVLAGDEIPVPDGYSFEGNPYCVVRISDSGPGISEEMKNRIFEPFYTTKEKGKGTGLGLSITQGIIANHGGVIEVSGSSGEGAVFEIFLPLAEGEVSGVKKDMPESAKGRGELVMVVDDNEDLLEVSEETLREAGFRVVTVSSGEEAVKVFADWDGEVSIVVLDILMPGMDGREVFRKLRKMNPTIKVLVVSAYSQEEKAAELKDAGVDMFIQKPCSMADLMKHIRHALDS